MKILLKSTVPRHLEKSLSLLRDVFSDPSLSVEDLQHLTVKEGTRSLSITDNGYMGNLWGASISNNLLEEYDLTKHIFIRTLVKAGSTKNLAVVRKTR